MPLNPQELLKKIWDQLGQSGPRRTDVIEQYLLDAFRFLFRSQEQFAQLCAFQYAPRCSELLIPHCLKVFRWQVENASIGYRPMDHEHLFAFCLLCYYRVPEIIPEIRRLFGTFPDYMLNDLFGLEYQERVPNFLSRLVGGEPEFYSPFLLDSRVALQVRQTIIAAHILMVRDGYLKRPQVVSLLRNYFQTALKTKDRELAQALVLEISYAGFEELTPEIQKCCQSGMMQEKKDPFKKISKLLKENAKQPLKTYMVNTPLSKCSFLSYEMYAQEACFWAEERKEDMKSQEEEDRQDKKMFTKYYEQTEEELDDDENYEGEPTEQDLSDPDKIALMATVIKLCLETPISGDSEKSAKFVKNSNRDIPLP